MSSLIKSRKYEQCLRYHTADFRFSIYVELADEYAKMDATSNVAKRNILADHLREVIDVLEQRVGPPNNVLLKPI